MVNKNLFINPSVCIPIYKSDLNEGESNTYNETIRSMFKEYRAAEKRGETAEFEVIKLKGFLPQIVDGEETLFRCYAASQEAQYTTVRDNRMHNFKAILKALRKGNAVEQIDSYLEDSPETIVSLAYFDFDYIDNRPNGGGLKTWNNGWAYRNDGVDIQVSSDSKLSKYHVSHTESGEFLKYTINVLKNDTYNFSIISSSEQVEASIALYNKQNQLIISEKKLPITQDYDLWVETPLGEAELEKGMNEIRLSIIRGGANLKLLKISSNSSRSGEVIFSHKVYPNPTSSSSNVAFESLSENYIKVRVYNLKGQLVWSDNAKASVGNNIYQFNYVDRFGKKLSNGIYFLTIDDGKKMIKEKITFVK